MSTRIFQFHQTLHGYEDGHRLLASSQRLPSSVERLMLTLSDMSGSSMVHGFEKYLTGYPLKELKSYAVARTWYAPEMKRPGCVWTHTLIISNADLAHLDPTALINLFVRPSSPSHNWIDYSNICNFEQVSNLQKYSVETPSYLTSKVLDALYNSSSKQVFIPVEEVYSKYESLTLAIWKQQWARLRRRFLFCTGAITNRRIYDDNFDLQFIPISSERELKLEIPDAVFINRESEYNENQNVLSDQWLKTALDDLYQNRETGLRSFMRLFGVEKTKGRADFSSLAQTFGVLKSVKLNRNNLESLTQSIANLFPEKTKGKKLKEMLYGQIDENIQKIPPFFTGLSEVELLSELSSTRYFEAFDAEALQICSRAESLSKNNFLDASKIAHSILESTLTPIGEKFLDGFCMSISPVEALKFAGNQVKNISPLLIRNRNLVNSPELWQGKEDEQRKIFDYIQNYLNPDIYEIELIITSMLRADSDYLAREIAYNFRQITVKTVLNYCNLLPVKKVFDVGRQWKLVLCDNPQICIKWLKNNTGLNLSSFVLLALLLNPHSLEVIDSGSRIWVNLCERISEIKDEKVLIAVASFLLSLGFNNPDNTAVELVKISFEIVHKAAEDNELNEFSWNYLAKQSPSVSWGGEWNKCERLRNALIERFIKYGWSHEDFLSCLNNTKLFELVVWQIMERSNLLGFDSQQKFLKKTAQKALSGKICSTNTQKNILSITFDI